ncbi:hypothetical protein EVJ58_g4013 [Rhodofomes roseus]|uniref:Uncharacterized protein n=1 Tax=Rhodofomes roseus TaxID=34475 RepID=A0A4Y9YL57_9APHY|nr:hypothetical protein EVJ58_g4013 [Rhodofomes roseus]
MYEGMLHHGLDKPGTLSSMHVTSRGAGGAAKRNEALNPARADRPSLLERLSNTASASPLEEIVRTAADTSGDSPQHDVAVRSPSVVPTQLQASVAATGAEARRSAFDGSSVGMPSARTDEAVPSATSDLPALLLSKLEAEKLNHLESAAATPGDSRRATDRAPSAHELSDCIGPEKEGGVVGAELYNSAERAAEREARLRSQAQLRMRLAAAKKAAASGAGRSSTEVNGGAAHDSGNGGEAQSQEELLRNRLVERRTSSGVDRP